MEKLVFLLVLNVLMAVGFSLLWRTSIYTRGGIFRFVGRLLDYWVYRACNPKATLWHKALRFIAYPLGRCIYCSSFHVSYLLFHLIHFRFNVSYWYVVPVVSITHLAVIIAMKYLILDNNDLAKDDWIYMKGNKSKILDLKQRKPSCPSNILNDEEEKELEKCKSGLSQRDKEIISYTG